MTQQLKIQSELLRDYFAGLAMCNAVVAPGKKPEIWMPRLARLSYRLADEMLNARSMTMEQLWKEDWKEDE
jgi:hypothetical protein